MWQYHDKKMLELKQLYNKTSKQTQNRLQEIFDSIDFKFDKLYSIADNKQKNKINTYIEEWKDKGLLTGYFGMLANNIYKRTRVKNNEILELLIYGAYIEEQYKLKDKELNIFKEDVNYYYQEGQKEVNKTLNKEKIVSVIPDAIFLAMLDMPNSKGYVYNDYIQSILKYNAEQLYRQVIIDIQQEKPLKIDSDVYQSIIKRQQNQKLNINNNKISGEADLTLIGLNNIAKSEAIYSFDKDAKVKFVSVEDKVTTKMCHSLNGQMFNVHDWNKFERYSESNGMVKKYKCYGLIPGLNLPPINDNFHWCRSTIEYIKNNIYEDNNIENTHSNNKEYGKTDYINKNIENICNELYEEYNKNKIENIAIIDSKNGELLGNISNSGKFKSVGYSLEQKNILKNSSDRSLIVVHNHPSNNTFSYSDIYEMIENNKICGIIVTTKDYNYFLQANSESLNITKQNIFEFKNWFEISMKNQIQLAAKTNNIDNDSFSLMYKNVFDKLRWNYGRKKR